MKAPVFLVAICHSHLLFSQHLAEDCAVFADFVLLFHCFTVFADFVLLFLSLNQAVSRRGIHTYTSALLTFYYFYCQVIFIVMCVIFVYYLIIIVKMGEGTLHMYEGTLHMC